VALPGGDGRAVALSHSATFFDLEQSCPAQAGQTAAFL
ncbi:MAG: hypothetical protein ACI93G_001186, partial [Hyphomonas sp.]